MSIFESKACKKTGIARVQKKTNPRLSKYNVWAYTVNIAELN